MGIPVSGIYDLVIPGLNLQVLITAFRTNGNIALRPVVSAVFGINAPVMVYDVVVINVQIVINVNTSHFAFLFYSAPAQRHRSGKDSFDPGAVQQKNKFPFSVNIKTKKPADCYTFADYCGKLQKFDPDTIHG